MSRSAVLLHRQRSPQDLQQLRAWYKIRDTLLGHNRFQQDIGNVLELASVCKHPNAVWLTKLFGGRDVTSAEDAKQVFLGCESDPRAVCFAGLLGWTFDEVGRVAELGDAFAQAWKAGHTNAEESFLWAEKSAAQGERDGLSCLAYCYRDGIGCEKDAERAKEYFLVSAELGFVNAMMSVGELFDKDDAQRFVWFGRAAASYGGSAYFLTEMSNQMRNFSDGTGHANVVFAIGRALKGQVDNEKRTIFGIGYNFDSHIAPANQALSFYEFQLQSYRTAVDSWAMIGLRNNVVKDIRKMIGKMIWDRREKAVYSEEKPSAGDFRAGSNC
jgi:TPR repeat protein